MSNETGRNDPCPCGSGKKYKNCCGRAAGSAVQPPDGVVGNVVQFANSAHWKAALDRAMDVYTEPLAQWSEVGYRSAIATHPELAHAFNLHFHEWLLSDYVDPGLGNVIDVYLQRRGWRETPNGRTWLALLREEPLSLYEVQAIAAGTGMTLRDVLREGPPVTVIERAGSHSARPWDYLVTRVVEFHGAYYLSGAGLRYTREMGEAARQELNARLNARAAQPTLQDWNALLRDSGPWFMTEYMQPFVEVRPQPTLLDASGDPVINVSQRFTFAPERRETLRARLAAHPEFDSTDGSYFHWLEMRGGEKRGARVLGSVRLDAERGRFEAMSKPRHARGHALLAELFGGIVQWLPASFEDAWQAAKNAPAREPAGAEAMPAHLKRELEHRALDDSYQQWFDQPVPMLGDQTPREAMQTKAGRAALVDLLKLYENGEAGKRAEDRYDFTWMWQELGLQRPTGGADDDVAEDLEGELFDDLDDDDIDDFEIEEDMLGDMDAVLAEIINKQIRENDPPETRKTYERLRREGYDDEEVMDMLCSVIDFTLHDLMLEEGSFDLKTYSRLLRKLPELPDGYGDA